MSIEISAKVKCHGCGTETDFTMWQSINTDMKFAAPDIISGKLFLVKCKGCGAPVHVDYPILFNDMEHKAMIYYVNPDQVDSAVSVSGMLRRLGCRVRVVTSQEALREKTAIFNAGLDDRIVELVKFLTLEAIRDRLEGKDIGTVFYNCTGGVPRLDMIIDGVPACYEIPADLYASVEKEYGEFLADGDYNDCFVDQKWVREFYYEIGELDDENAEYGDGSEFEPDDGGYVDDMAEYDDNPGIISDEEYDRREAQHEEDLERMDFWEMMTDDDYDGDDGY